MSLLKERPEIRLLLPREIRPGERVESMVVLDAREEIFLEQIRTELVGTAKGSACVRLGATLAEQRLLPEGRTQLPFAFALPRDAPPSYVGQHAAVSYTLGVHAALPWWPEARASFALHVLPVDDAPPNEPYLFSTAPEGPRATELTIEGSLHTRVLRPGEPLVGQLALTNLEFHRVHGIELRLVRSENGSVLSASVDATQYVLRIAAPQRDAETVAFRMSVPELITPSFTTPVVSVRWTLEICARVRLGEDLVVSVPITVGARTSLTRTEPWFAPPSIGSARVHATWRHVADQLAMKLEDGVLSQRVGGVDVAVGRHHRGRDGLYLVAILRHASVHLDLDGGVRTGFRRFVRPELRLDEPWDRHHYVGGRDPDQARAYVTYLLGHLFDTPLRLTDLHDEGLQLEWRNAGHRLQALTDFVHAALTVAGRVGDAASQVPVPGDFRASGAKWRALVASLDRGVLEPARMAASGLLGGVRVQVITEWGDDGRPLVTRLCVAPESPNDPRWRVGLATGDGSMPPLPADARRLALGLAEEHGMRITDRTLETFLPAPLDDAKAALPLLLQLVRVASALRTHSGPYR